MSMMCVANQQVQDIPLLSYTSAVLHPLRLTPLLSYTPCVLHPCCLAPLPFYTIPVLHPASCTPCCLASLLFYTHAVLHPLLVNHKLLVLLVHLLTRNLLPPLRPPPPPSSTFTLVSYTRSSATNIVDMLTRTCLRGDFVDLLIQEVLCT